MELFIQFNRTSGEPMPRNLVTTLLLGLLAGCAGQPVGGIFNSGANDESYAHNNEPRDWHPLPHRGDRLTVVNETTGSETVVTAVEPYNAASGRTCVLYTESGTGETRIVSGIACRGNNHWIEVPFITNPYSRRSVQSGQ